MWPFTTKPKAMTSFNTQIDVGKGGCLKDCLKTMKMLYLKAKTKFKDEQNKDTNYLRIFIK